MRGQTQLFSKGKDDWQTPQALFDKLNRRWEFSVDGAANAQNHLLPRWWGPQSPLAEDSLVIPWTHERVWLNPPYSMCSEFMEKAYIEMTVNEALTVALVPARTDTKWFHKWVYLQRGVSVEFLKGRLKFVDPSGKPSTSAPFPSMVVLFDPRKL